MVLDSVKMDRQGSFVEITHKIGMLWCRIGDEGTKGERFRLQTPISLFESTRAEMTVIVTREMVGVAVREGEVKFQVPGHVGKGLVQAGRGVLLHMEMPEVEFVQLLNEPTDPRPLTFTDTAPRALSWNVPQVVGRSLLQVARDPDFLRMMLEVVIPRRSFRPAALGPGKYWWRVLAMDPNGLTGRSSRIYSFKIAQ